MGMYKYVVVFGFLDVSVENIYCMCTYRHSLCTANSRVFENNREGKKHQDNMTSIIYVYKYQYM